MKLCRVYIPNTFSPFKVFFLSLRSGLYYHLAIIKQKLLIIFIIYIFFWGRSTHPLPHPTGGMFRYTAAKYKKVLLPSLHTRHLNGNPAMTSLFLFTFSYLVLAVAGEVFCQGEVTHTLTKNTLQFQY